MCVSEKGWQNRACRISGVTFLHTDEAGKEELGFFCGVNVDIVGVPAELGESLRLGRLYAGTVAFHSGNLAVGIDSNGAIVKYVQLSPGLAVDKCAKQQLVSLLARMHL